MYTIICIINRYTVNELGVNLTIVKILTAPVIEEVIKSFGTPVTALLVGIIESIDYGKAEGLSILLVRLVYTTPMHVIAYLIGKCVNRSSGIAYHIGYNILVTNPAYHIVVIAYLIAGLIISIVHKGK